MYSAALIKEKYKEDKRVRFAIVDDKKIGLTGTFQKKPGKYGVKSYSKLQK